MLPSAERETNDRYITSSYSRIESLLLQQTIFNDILVKAASLLGNGS